MIKSRTLFLETLEDKISLGSLRTLYSPPVYLLFVRFTKALISRSVITIGSDFVDVRVSASI